MKKSYLLGVAFSSALVASPAIATDFNAMKQLSVAPNFMSDQQLATVEGGRVSQFNTLFAYQANFNSDRGRRRGRGGFVLQDNFADVFQVNQNRRGR